MPRALCLTAFVFLGLTITVSAQAQSTAPKPSLPEGPKETISAETVTAGETNILDGDFAAALKQDDPSHVTDVSLAFGGLFSAGNARQVAVTSVAKGRIRRKTNQFAFAAAANYARAGNRGEVFNTTVSNAQGLLRYDYFLSDRFSLFFQATGRRDRFQGLDLRLNLDPGAAYAIFDTKRHRLGVELGYDLQHDIRRDGTRTLPLPEGSPPGTIPDDADKTKTLHNSRAFVGYENKLRKEVSLNMSLEYIQDFGDFGTYRVIGDIGLKSNVSDKFALATTYTARYENKPIPGVDRLDSIASFNLVYSFF